MAWTYSQINNGLHDGGTTAANIRAQIAVAVADVAQVVYNEVGSTTGHAARAAYATKVVNAGAESVGTVMATSVALAASAAGAAFPPTDTDIKTAVQAVWNLFAGA